MKDLFYCIERLWPAFTARRIIVRQCSRTMPAWSVKSWLIFSGRKTASSGSNGLVAIVTARPESGDCPENNGGLAHSAPPDCCVRILDHWLQSTLPSATKAGPDRRAKTSQTPQAQVSQTRPLKDLQGQYCNRPNNGLRFCAVFVLFSRIFLLFSRAVGSRKLRPTTR